MGLLQALELKREFGIEFEWRGYELYPDSVEFPTSPALPKVVTNRPETPTRMALAYAAQGIERPTNRGPGNLRTHHAHEAVELAKLGGTQDALVERLYRAYWEEAQDISDPAVLIELASAYVNPLELEQVLRERRFAANIVEYDVPAYATGVYNVPTFWIGGDRYAEQPYEILRKAMLALPSAVS